MMAKSQDRNMSIQSLLQTVHWDTQHSLPTLLHSLHFLLISGPWLCMQVCLSCAMADHRANYSHLWVPEGQRRPMSHGGERVQNPYEELHYSSSSDLTPHLVKSQNCTSQVGFELVRRSEEEEWKHSSYRFLKSGMFAHLWIQAALGIDIKCTAQTMKV